MFCAYLQREESETACYLHNPHKTGTAFQKPPQNTSLSMLELHQLPNYVILTFLLQCAVYMRWNSWCKRARYVLQSYSPYTRVVNTLSPGSTTVQLQNFNHTPLNHFARLQNCVSYESQNKYRLSPTHHHMSGPNRDLVRSLQAKAKHYACENASIHF